MRARTGLMVAVVVSVAWANLATGQGLYWESTTTGIGNEPRTSQTYTMPKMVKIVTSDGKAMILRTDQDKFVLLDTKKKTYRRVTFNEMDATGKTMQAEMEAARAEMEKKLKDMPPEQREMVEKMLPPKDLGAAAAQPSAVAVKNTGETKTISGYLCTKYVATEGDNTVLVAWTTKDVKGFEGIRDDWLAYQQRLAKANRSLGDAASEAYGKIEGFPIETEMHNIKTVVTKVEPRTTAASEFEVPTGYTKESVKPPQAPKP